MQLVEQSDGNILAFESKKEPNISQVKAEQAAFEHRMKIWQKIAWQTKTEQIELPNFINGMNQWPTKI